MTEQHFRVAGVWTPQASVLCWSCHGSTWHLSGKPVPDFDRISTEEADTNEATGVTVCDECGRGIVVDLSIAREHDLARRLKADGFDAHMAQTGGMCSAMSVSVEDCPTYFLATDAEEYTTDTEPGSFLVCRYSTVFEDSNGQIVDEPEFDGEHDNGWSDDGGGTYPAADAVRLIERAIQVERAARKWSSILVDAFGGIAQVIVKGADINDLPAGDAFAFRRMLDDKDPGMAADVWGEMRRLQLFNPRGA